MKDYIAIIGVTTLVAAASVFAAWSALSEAENSGDSNSTTAAIQSVSVPMSAVPEANGESLKMVAKNGMQSKKPIITIEEVNPKEQKKAIKKKLDAKAKEKANPKSTDLMKEKRVKERKAAEMKKKAAEKKKSSSKKPEDMQAEKDSGDPGRIIFGSRPEPFPTSPAPKEDVKLPGPMELLNANDTLLTKIVNNTAGPSPDELHGTWEIMPCHSNVGVIATRSFKTQGMTPGAGAYYEIVQFYSDPEKKVFGLQTETTVYVKIDKQHMLAGANANTSRPKFSVLRKISAEIQEADVPEDDEMEIPKLPEGKDDDMKSVKSKDSKKQASKETKKKNDGKTAKKESMKSDKSAKKMSDKDAKKMSDKNAKKMSDKDAMKKSDQAAKKKMPKNETGSSKEKSEKILKSLKEKARKILDNKT